MKCPHCRAERHVFGGPFSDKQDVWLLTIGGTSEIMRGIIAREMKL